ncbi:MAG: competence/damage-inducible protein A [Kiritimatiellae bacterium]|nr:competence/damage-inducible protein A [Kiritimatiellia bacterium]
MRAVILSIGDELVLGQTADTNAAWIAARLVACGIAPEYHQAVRDDQDAIIEAVKNAAGKAELIIVSGGLGPTPDDLTRQAMAAAGEAPLVLHAPSLKKLEKTFKTRGWKMTANNRIQAMFPQNAIVLDNPVGTAPGFGMPLGKAKIMVMPGVPKEMKAMFARHIAPVIMSKKRSGVQTMKLNVFGMGESMAAAKLGELMRRDRNPLVGTTVSAGIISIRIRGVFKNAAKGRQAMRGTADKIRRLLGRAVFSEGDESLPEAVGKMLAAARKTVATAESCTAGMLAAMLTETPGASRYFTGGWIVYANRMKTENLGVPEELILGNGAVSAAVAKKMAGGALLKSGADYALAITGIAGPDGGAPRKKVGTVWIALAERKSGGIHAEKSLFPGDRAMVRDRAAKTALNMLRLNILSGLREWVPQR